MSQRRVSGVLKALVACLVVVAFAVAMSAIFTTPASAVSGPGVTSYYSDATYKTVVGRESYGCCGEYSFWGKKTIWRKFQRVYCLDVLCPN